MAPARIARIVSGGQSGADRAALDAAIAARLEYGGWCPANGWAEDYPEPPGLLEHYPALRETGSADPAVRTELNVRDSHATLILRTEASSSPGSDFTVAVAARLRRPYLVSQWDTDEISRWLVPLGYGLTLNVAGPRESEQPGVYESARGCLTTVLEEFAPGR